MLVWALKDPDESVWRELDWRDHSSWIAGDFITMATFSLSTAAGMTIAAGEDDGCTVSRVRLAGGTSGQRGKVLCQVTTDEGQTLQQTATILIRSR